MKIPEPENKENLIATIIFLAAILILGTLGFQATRLINTAIRTLEVFEAHLCQDMSQRKICSHVDKSYEL